MPMSWEEFRTFLMNSQPFRIRRMFYQLNQKGANLPMLGSQREQVSRLMERFRRIPADQQRQIFPEYFRDRARVRNAIQGQNGSVRNGQNNSIDDNHSITAVNRPSRQHASHESRPVTSFPARAPHTLIPRPPARIERLYVPVGQYTSNSVSVRNTEDRPRTPNLDMRPTLSETFDFHSPLRLAPTGPPDRARLAPTVPPDRARLEPVAPPDRATYQLTPRPQRRLSFSGSPAPPSASSRRRSMSVSMEGNGPCVTATSTEDTCGKMANLECKICMDEMVECAFKPCGHACSCYGCARHLRFSLGRCPICRGIIAEVIRIYW